MLVAAMVLCGPINPALAQRDLPSQLITKTTELSTSELDQIRTLVHEAIPLLTSKIPADLRRGRTALRKPLMNPAVSVSFRFEYSDIVVPELEGVLRLDGVTGRVNALRITGEIATERAAQLAVRALDDPDTTVRYTAAYALGLTFTAIRNASPAMTQDQGKGLLRALGDRLSKEDDPFVLDRIIRSLGAAARIDGKVLTALRPLAIDQICEHVGQRLRTIDTTDPDQDRIPLIQMFLRSADVVQREFIGGDRLPDPTMVKAGGFGGDCLAFVARRSTTSEPSTDERKLLVALAITGEQITFFARSQLESDPNRTPKHYKIALEYRDGDDQAFLRDLGKLIGQGGDLTKPPFGFDVARFHL